jgi:peptidyl-tRNA hydrolase
MAAYDIKMVIVVRKDTGASHGKLMSQTAHAVLGVFTDMFEQVDSFEYSVKVTPEIKEWLDGSFAKTVKKCDSLEDIEKIEKWAQEQGISYKKIIDNGTTQFNNIPTVTCIALGPCKTELFDNSFIAEYKLY